MINRQFLKSLNLSIENPNQVSTRIILVTKF